MTDVPGFLLLAFFLPFVGFERSSILHGCSFSFYHLLLLSFIFSFERYHHPIAYDCPPLGSICRKYNLPI